MNFAFAAMDLHELRRIGFNFLIKILPSFSSSSIVDEHTTDFPLLFSGLVPHSPDEILCYSNCLKIITGRPELLIISHNLEKKV